MPPPASDAAAGDGGAALALVDVQKRFGRTVALDGAGLRVRAGTVHALLGENGAGKSTLVNVAFGHLRPDAGTVAVGGVRRTLASPRDAIAAGVGMVHQHFLLVPAMTVAENVALGRPGRHDLRRVAREIAAIGEATGLRVDPLARVDGLDVAAQQRVEIVKALARGARVLLLDEPTAVLAPTEAAELLAWVRRYVGGGNAAVLITHKLREALAHADDVTVLRRGRTVLAAAVAEMTEDALVAAMLGGPEGADGGGGARGGGGGAMRATRAARASLGIPAAEPVSEQAPEPAAEPAPEPVSEPASGQASEAASGQATRARAGGPPPEFQDTTGNAPDHHPITARRTTSTDARSTPPHAPSAATARTRPIPPADRSTTTATPPRVVLRLDHAGYRDDRGVERLRDVSLAVHAGELLGVAGVEGAGHLELLRLLAGRLRPTAGTAALPPDVGFVPEDRQRDALVLDFPLTENVLLLGAGARGGRLRWGALRERTRRLLAEHRVRAAGPDAPASALSGGNQQKLVLGRELQDDPPALVAESPTRGLDVRASAAVLAALRAVRDRGAAVVVHSSDLDELLAIADRVVVAYAGGVSAVPLERGAIGRALVGAAGDAG